MMSFEVQLIVEITAAENHADLIRKLARAFPGHAVCLVPSSDGAKTVLLITKTK